MKESARQRDQGVEREARAVFVLKLEAPHGTDAIRELRWALKTLLRKHRLRCVSIEQDPPEEDRP
jgi:hypothetical protein